MKKHHINKTIIAWIYVVGWMVAIFFLSSQVASASNSLSLSVTNRIQSLFSIILPDVNLIISNHDIRKLAHFVVFAVLGFLLANAFIKSNINVYRSLIYSGILIVMYSIGDELHQRFVPGRGPGLGDVLIDIAGGAFGILSFLILLGIFTNIEKNKLNKKIN
ncbi:VanZ family protein [Acidaminobacter sp. JC074]|uniref:VanZ family protein n=1 Tax=Acidaminobacter sp. JC074 TaxID=2530199 RepID=UPI001F0F75C2|nr:VanZ family protein [Acidaminobacter sp. JC074]MCH4890301.1 VanZ family protein [Acidaminobacter sp. JC074]